MERYMLYYFSKETGRRILRNSPDIKNFSLSRPLFPNRIRITTKKNSNGEDKPRLSDAKRWILQQPTRKLEENVMFEKLTISSRNGKISTKDFSPDDTENLSKEDIKDEYHRLHDRFAELQEAFYASKKYALLIVLQGMDCSGKDGAVKKALSGVNPNGFYVEDFKVPTPVEIGHDYLWRVHQKMPKKGDIVVFNRSYYEDVLVTRVHGMIDDDTAHKRFEEIRNFEKYLVGNNTVPLKFFLHISKDFQQKKLEERLENPDKNWKFSESDLKERKFWDEYQKCYSDVLSHCGTKHAPWHVVPANHRWFRDYFILSVIVKTLEALPGLQFPVIGGNVQTLIKEVEDSR